MNYLIATTIILLFTSPLVSAKHHRNYHNARVIDVAPVYHYVTVNNSALSCQHSYAYQKAPNAAVLGSIIGGSIAHANSDKRHKVINTITGAIIGGAIGHTINYHSIKSPHKNCRNRQSNQTVVKRRELKGYTVSYKVKGRIYQTFSKHKPSKHIRIYH